MATCLVIEHAEPERPYLVAEALTGAGVDVATVRPYAGEPIPGGTGSCDGLVVMGGSMSATGDEGFPSRRAELALLADALGRGTPTLGICLGAQLLALAAGGSVHRGDAGLQLGWSPVDLEPAAATDPLFAGVAGPIGVLHWHGDTYDLPPGAVHLAADARYRQQAFRVGERAWGLQFHLEVDEAAVAAFARGFPEDLATAGTTAAALTEATPDALAALAPARTVVLDRFAALVARGRP